LIVALAFALSQWLDGRRYARQVGRIQEQLDSILSAAEETEEELRGRNEALAEALYQSRADIQGLRNDLESAEERGDTEEVESLRIQLQEAQAALVRQQLAAAIDYESIDGANGRAVAKVFVDFGDEVTSATAFAVREDGILLTNRHVVAGASGSRRAERIAVQFADSRQFWPARVVGISQAEDLAALKVDNIIGDVPTVTGFNMSSDTLSSGQAVAVIGFPLGGANPYGEGEGQIARTTLTTGVIASVSERLLRVNGYGVEGSSGSPIFDRSGLVVGVLYGGEIENGERTLHAVPASKAAALLDRLF
jgi:S1-C subfamily serine protease